MHFPNNKDLEAPVKHCTYFNKIRCDSFYNIPSSIGKSPKPGIGLGKKIDIAKKSLSPSPNKYNISSDFDLTKKNVTMGKFALGRDVTSILYQENQTKWNFCLKRYSSTWKILIKKINDLK